MPHVPMPKLMIIDDHFVVRSGLVASLELEDDMQVVAEADRGEEAGALFAKHRPEVVLMDLQLPGISGVEATALLKSAHTDARVLIFSTFARDEEVMAALKAGALGYLQKSASRDQLLGAIRAVAKGGTLASGGSGSSIGAAERGSGNHASGAGDFGFDRERESEQGNRGAT